MPITLNLAGVTDELVAVPAGNYAVTVSSVTQQLSKSSNQPMLAMKLRIDEPEEQAGRILFDNFSLQPQALWKLKRFLRVVGYSDDDLESEALELEPDELVGLDCVAAVIVKPFVRNPGTEAEETVERNNIAAYTSSSVLDVQLGAAPEGDVEGFKFDF